MDRLLETLRALRAPDGCPWDREQTHESLRADLLEEASEAVDALGDGHRDAVVDELGDVLLQVGFHAVLGEESGRFDYGAVERAVVAKLVRRHPHVFGEARASDAAEVQRHWEAAKAAESGAVGSPAARVPRSLPALQRAAALDEALSWPLDEAVGEMRLAEVPDEDAALAAALLYVAQRARRAGLEPELLLRDELSERARESDP